MSIGDFDDHNYYNMDMMGDLLLQESNYLIEIILSPVLSGIYPFIKSKMSIRNIHCVQC